MNDLAMVTTSRAGGKMEPQATLDRNMDFGYILHGSFSSRKDLSMQQPEMSAHFLTHLQRILRVLESYPKIELTTGFAHDIFPELSADQAWSALLVGVEGLRRRETLFSRERELPGQPNNFLAYVFLDDVTGLREIQVLVEPHAVSIIPLRYVPSRERITA